MKEDKNEYKGWLNSDNFLKRAFAVMGYQFVAGLILWGGLVILLVFLGFLIGFFGEI